MPQKTEPKGKCPQKLYRYAESAAGAEDFLAYFFGPWETQEEREEREREEREYEESRKRLSVTSEEDDRYSNAGAQLVHDMGMKPPPCCGLPTIGEDDQDAYNRVQHSTLHEQGEARFEQHEERYEPHVYEQVVEEVIEEEFASSSREVEVAQPQYQQPRAQESYQQQQPTTYAPRGSTDPAPANRGEAPIGFDFPNAQTPARSCVNHNQRSGNAPRPHDSGVVVHQAAPVPREFPNKQAPVEETVVTEETMVYKATFVGGSHQ